MSATARVGTGNGQDLRATLQVTPGAPWPTYRLALQPGSYYLGASETIAILDGGVVDSGLDPVLDDDGNPVCLDGSWSVALTEEQRLFSTAPVTHTWTIYKTLPGSPGARDVLQSAGVPFVFFSLENAVPSGSPVLMSGRLTSGGITTAQTWTQVPALLVTERLPVLQRRDGSLALSYGRQCGPVHVVSAVTDDGTAVGTTTEAGWIVTTSAARRGESVTVTYWSEQTFALVGPGTLLCAAPLLSTGASLALDVTFCASGGLRACDENLYPLASGFLGGFAFIAESAPSPATAAFTGSSATGIVYTTSDATKVYQPYACSVVVRDVEGLPVGGATVSWRVRPVTGSTPGSWTALSAGHTTQYVVQLTTDLRGRSSLAMNTAGFQAILSSGRTALDIEMTCGSVVTTVRVPITAAVNPAQCYYLQCTCVRQAVQPSAPYVLAAWLEHNGVREAITGEVTFYRRVNGVPVKLSPTTSESSFPYTVTYLDGTSLQAGEQCYAVLVQGDLTLQSNRVAVPS